MSRKTTLAAMAVWALISANANAQSDFFWSFNDLNSGATNSAAEGTFRAGETGTLFLYYDTRNSDLDTGAGLDLSLTSSDVIEFTGAQTYDFTINIGGAPISNRWRDFSGGGGFAGNAQQVNANTIVGLNAFTVTGGLGVLAANNGNPFFDEGYDNTADAFLFGSVDFIVTGRGSTDISAVVGAIGIVHDGQSLNPTFGNATITVVPEPTSTCLIVAGLFGVSATRRRE